MRKLVALLSMLTAVSAVAADMWRWRDADGVMHYSDRPVPGAERMNMQAPQSTGDAASAQNPNPGATTTPRPEAAAPPPVRYTRCEIQRPARDEVFNAVDTVTVSVALEPALLEGYRMQMFVNGAEYTDWPAGATTYSLQNLFRGSYSLSARVVGPDGKAACLGPPVTFHIRQPTINSPARRPVPAPRGG
jgi:hypothetical protein